MTTSQCRLTETVVDGDQCLVLQTDRLRVAINADHGTHIYELTDLRSGVNLLHTDPKGSRHYDVGGWYELFPNAGAACTLDGRPISGHGDIQHRRWSYDVRATGPDVVEIDFATDSADLPFHVDKTVRLTPDDALTVSETITNASDGPLPYLWGHHVTFGESFLTASIHIDLPDVDVYSRGSTTPPAAPYAPAACGRLNALPARDGDGVVDLSSFPSEPFAAMLHTDAMPEHWYRIWSADLRTGLGVTWDGAAFPGLWIWAVQRAGVKNPDLVACALEPQSCEVPTLADAVAAKRAPTVEPGDSRTGWVKAALLHDPGTERPT